MLGKCLVNANAVALGSPSTRCGFFYGTFLAGDCVNLGCASYNDQQSRVGNQILFQSNRLFEGADRMRWGNVWWPIRNSFSRLCNVRNTVGAVPKKDVYLSKIPWCGQYPMVHQMHSHSCLPLLFCFRNRSQVTLQASFFRSLNSV